MEAAKDDHAKFVAHDLLFHQAVFHAAGNRVTSLMFSVVHKSLDKLITMTSQVVEPEHTLTLHRRIYQAIRKRDQDESRRRMTEHLVDARDLLTRAAEKQSHFQMAARIQTLKKKEPRPSR
jgi:DNA-binding FadR family transcriptional regulator